MTRHNPTPELLENILNRIPEGFIHKSELSNQVAINQNKGEALKKAITAGVIGQYQNYYYDTSRLTLEQLHKVVAWCRPSMPHISRDGSVPGATVTQALLNRAEQLPELIDEAALLIFNRMEQTSGYATPESLCQSEEEAAALKRLLNDKILLQSQNLIYDPLRLTLRTVNDLARQQRFTTIRRQISDYLQQKPGQTALHSDVQQAIGKQALNDVMGSGGFKTFTTQTKAAQTLTWIHLKGGDDDAAHKAAHAYTREQDEAWEEERNRAWEIMLDKCGEVLRDGARDGKTAHLRVTARSYTLDSAAKRIGVRLRALERAIRAGQVMTFEDPDGKQRIAAEIVEKAALDAEYAEQITAYEILNARDISIVCEVTYPTTRRRLQKAGISRTDPRWSEVRGKWDLPNTYREYHSQLKTKIEEWRAKREAERLAEIQRKNEEERLEKERRVELRAKLVAAFPTWRHDGRADQRMLLHVGPPNSGKTYDALQALMQAGSGWYLAPLRLLAFEIFDRLNQQGVSCNLLTGEEFIPVDGARITAATVEMFNPRQSGDCIIVDEAQMLADPDRGWAWTRALMEAQAADIHVIGPVTVQKLIIKLASAAAIPIEIVEHERLAPIKIADKHWALNQLPPKTILVAFSRQMVLGLKTELEQMKRTVSVVYGNLPPEVRRKQADRFANGETEICVATDAVGMGLNLPADYVCFYEVTKFDGRTRRVLTPAEVQQIGGRAGRYGLSKAGEIGATRRADLKTLADLYQKPAQVLTHARVAPTVEDLQLIPGNLASKLVQWASLGSIPDSLRGAIDIADMAERVELARMLTDREVNLLGLASALKLVNAPTRKETREYWYRCARAILTDKSMPFPPVAPVQINDSVELEAIEYSISCSDIYLWLSQRPEFNAFGPHEPEVRVMRGEWSLRIDEALLRKINTMRRCSRCGKPLHLKHPYGICDDCFYQQRYGSNSDFDDDYF
jgi:DEXQ-box helicase domain of Suv3/Helicase conserved C-terminal domain